MANLPQSFSVGVGSFGEGDGMSSLSFGAGAPPNKDRKMQSAEQLVFVLYNPNLRENTLQELFKVFILHTLEVYSDILD
uniref:Cell differentiation protein rcd1 n=1 Tax=Solanum tuberosum TaxID=4113 RepID=M1B544_SOLTU